MGTLLVSDLHLGASRPAATHAFLDFINTRAPGAEALYVLGDLFDAWLGDDDEAQPALDVATALLGLASTGTRVHLMPGNRDFLLGAGFAARAGATLLPDPCCIEISGRRVVLTHGDLLCSEDHAYQRYRAIARHRITRSMLLALPLSARRAVARGLRHASRSASARKPAPLLDASAAACERMMREHDAHWLVHGHTHRPGRHVHASGTRCVLGAWDQTATYLAWPRHAEPGFCDIPVVP